MLTIALSHQATLGLEERMTAAARFVLRRLLANLSEMAESEEVEVWQTAREGMLITAVSCAALQFSRRMGEEADERAGRRLLNVELANVLNLRWFNRILTPRDGGAIVFATQGR